MIEEIKLIGSLAGLGTLVFTIYDRLRAGAPRINIVRRGPKGGRRWALELMNPSKATLFITKVSWAPPIFGIAPDDSMLGITHAAVGDPPALLIDGEQKCRLPLVPLLHIKADPNKRSWLVVHWRNATSHWLPTIPRFKRLSLAEIEKMADAAAFGANED